MEQQDRRSGTTPADGDRSLAYINYFALKTLEHRYMEPALDGVPLDTAGHSALLPS